MSLYFAFTAILLCVTYVGSNQCPTLEQMGPCNCLDRFWVLDVYCNGSLVDEIRDALANVAYTKQLIYTLEIENVWIPNLSSNLLLGLQVQSLAIRNCSTASVNEDAFADIGAKLRNLFLTHNAIERVPSKSFEKCLKLTDLSLANNRIDILHAAAFSSLVSLRQLSLIGNRIKFIHDSAFVGVQREFGYLHLSGNALTAVPCTPLCNFSSVQYLNLRSNKIASLLPGELDMCGMSLRSLNMANNSIRHLPDSVFNSTRRLHNVDLSGNTMESIHPSAFEGTEATLVHLSLGHNQLEEVPSAALKNMRVLQSVYLNDNKICKIRKNEFLAYGKSIKYIDLQNNSLKYLDRNAFNGLHTLVTMDLRSNQLKTLPFETFSNISDTLGVLYIHDNPLHCDCNLRWLKERVYSIAAMPEETKCATPMKFANVPLHKIAIDQLVCDDNKTSNPPEPCCNCFGNSQQGVSINSLVSILQISFMYLLTTVLTKR